MIHRYRIHGSQKYADDGDSYAVAYQRGHKPDYEFQASKRLEEFKIVSRVGGDRSPDAEESVHV